MDRRVVNTKYSSLCTCFWAGSATLDTETEVSHRIGFEFTFFVQIVEEDEEVMVIKEEKKRVAPGKDSAIEVS